jgi:hypothetical protein
MFQTGSDEVTRELVGSLEVWDVGARAKIRLEAGLLVSALRIRRQPLEGPAVTPYLTEFECGGRAYTCPLYRFQARTQTAELEFAGALPERSVAAV